MLQRRVLALFGATMAGEGLMKLLQTSAYWRLWRMGPEPARKAVDQMAANPAMGRSFAAAQLAFGIWLALRQTK